MTQTQGDRPQEPVIEQTFRLPRAVLFGWVGYKPKTQSVADYHNSDAALRIITAPARSSKSYAAAYDAWTDAYPDFDLVRMPDGRKITFPRRPAHGNDRLIWIVGPDYKTLKEWQYLWTLFLSTGRKKAPIPYSILSKANSPHQGNLRLVIDWGKSLAGENVRTILEGKSATNPESLQGEEVDVAILSEAAELDEKIWTRYLGTRTRRASAPTTPKLSAQWLKDLVDQSDLDPALGIAHFCFDGRANPLYDWERFEREKRKACLRSPSGDADDDPWFAEQFLGRWTMASEQAVPFVPEPTRIHPGHVRDERPSWLPLARWSISCDYGYADAAVALFHAVSPSGQICVCAEVYERRMTAVDFVAAIRSKAVAMGIHVDYVVGDPKKPEVAAHMRKAGLPVWDRPDRRAIADRAATFLALADRLALNESGEPGLVLLSEHAGEHMGCPRSIRELRTLRRKQGFSGDPWGAGALSGDDHALDALRYAVATFPTVREPASLSHESQSLRAHLRRLRAQRSVTWSPRPLVGGAAHLSLERVAS